MSQAWHIFLKDLRALRIETAFFLTLLAVTAWVEVHLSDPSWAEILAVLAADLAIVRVIHNEAIAGQNQFWVSRPYSRKSLLTAKLLFIALVIQLPAALAQLSMVFAWNFRLSESIAGLFAWQIFFLCATVPAVCLASLTSDMAAFFGVECVLLAAAFGMYELTQPGSSFANQAPQSESWIRGCFTAAILCLSAAFVLYRQYRGSDTVTNRLCALAGLTLAGLAFLAFPSTASLRIQTWLSPQPFDSSRLRASLGNIRESVFPIRGLGRTDPSEVNIPIHIHGLPKGTIPIADAVFVSMMAAEGQSWSRDFVPVMIRPDEPGSLLMNLGLSPDPRFFAAQRHTGVTLRIGLYLTLFGNTKAATIPVRNEPVDIIDGLQCSGGVLMQFSCQSLFRWPDRLITATTAGSPSTSGSVSYSPWPADAETLAVERRPFAIPLTAREVTISSGEPLSHIRAELTIPDVVLARFTIEAKRFEDRGVGFSSFQ
jgi:hypothetical protein